MDPPDAGADGDAGAQAAGPPDAGVDETVPRLAGPDRVVDGIYFVAEGAPDPRVCARDTDCIGDSVPDQTGCCVRDLEPKPQTWAWHAWIAERRMSQQCDGVKCAPLPVGRRAPEICKLEARCASGRCVNGCE
jgi:hypothetical protein